MDIIHWLIHTGTNGILMGFLDNNSMILAFTASIIFMYLKYRAKRTPSPDDDELVASIEAKVNALFHGAIDKKINQ